MSEPPPFIPIGKRLSLTYKAIGFRDDSQPPAEDGIEAEGIRFTAERLLEVGTRLDIMLRLPNRREPIQFVGEVVWSGGLQDERGGECEVAVQFGRIDPRDREFLLQYGSLYGP